MHLTDGFFQLSLAHHPKNNRGDNQRSLIVGALPASLLPFFQQSPALHRGRIRAFVLVRPLH
ncbi:Uncharacterised protein [Vibrio cholerae]|nr:Uncharacterised protein [Vibrio cholerae]